MSSTEYFSELKKRLEAAEYGSQGDLIKAACEFLGISRPQVYRELKKVGWSSCRKQRADKGSSVLLREEVLVIANLINESHRNNGKKLLSVENAMSVAKANGLIKQQVSPSTASRQMRELGVHPEQLRRPTPHVRLRSLHPNHVWQFDVSLCVLYYLDTSGLTIMDERLFYKNKPENVKKIEKCRVLRYLATDHYSGAFYVKYVMSQGETQEALFNFLVSAFQAKASTTLMHGVPKILIWDKGSANGAFMIRNLLDRLDVKHIAHTTHTPRAKGQVESTHNIVETQFESRLFLLKIQDVNHLNACAEKWQSHFNAVSVMRRHGSSRAGMWQTIKQNELRISPSREIMEMLLHTKPEKRIVRGDLTISYAIKGEKSREYRVRHIQDVRCGEEIDVCVNPYAAPNIWVVMRDTNGKAVYHDCEPMEKDNAGFFIGAPVIGEEFKTAPDTRTDTLRKDLAEAAYGVRDKQDVDKARSRKQVAFAGEIDPITYLEKEQIPEFMSRRGTQLVVETPARQASNLSHIRALKLLREKIGRNLSPKESKSVMARYPAGVPEADIEKLAEDFCGHLDKRQAKTA